MFKQKLLSMVLLAGMLLGQSVPLAQAATTCDQAQFVSDITVPDGASFAPGASFTKTWRFVNIGTCTWTTAYKLVYAGGDVLGTTASVNLPVNVPPGQMLDISVNLTAPAAAGHYKSLWKFANESGGQFGIGDSANESFWVDINVVSTNAVVYDFVANAPYAIWKSGAGTLLYPGTSGDRRGFAYQVDRPHLEDDSYDSLPGILTVPQNKYNGYIQATYPEFQVQQGDKLETLVNCEFGATGCYVTFRIDYLLPNGLQKKFWQWKEAYDNRFYRASIDLSPLAGQKVRFVFMLLSTGTASNDRAIWGSPRIIRAGTIQPPAPPPTLTPLPPLTPTPTPITPPPPTIEPLGCDRAAFVTDVNVPDGTIFTPGAAFSKTWRLKNTGSCTWTKDYRLTYYSGEVMNAQVAVPMPFYVYPGETVDVTVNMVAPSAPGNYRSFWILANASGKMFGIGSDASNPFWVEINVAGEPAQENGYNFWSNVCAAQWKSGAGYLPCPGTDGDSTGFVIADNFSHLEDGTMGPAPTLLMSPQNKYNGYIQGFYPAITVQPGDHFRSVVGCDYGSTCYVTFRLDYMNPNGYIGNFWQRREVNDSKNYTVDVDLSPLAGRSVRFILTILATGSASGDRVRWGAPMIIRAGADIPATPIPQATTQVPSPTFTPSPTNTPEAPIYAPTISSLHMLDELNGWAISDRYVLRTFNGGKNWAVARYESMPAGGFFPTINKAWVISNYAEASAGSLYRTIDGGANWTRYDVPFNGGSIQFLDDNIGYVLQITGAAMQKQSVVIYKTSDGGATWTLKYNNDPTVPGSSNSLPLGGHKNGMTFSNAATGWIGGDTPTDGYFYFYKTIDSGVTWSRLQLALPAGYESAYITTTAPKFFGANDGILPVWMGIGIGMRDLFLYVTHDGGNTWTPSTAFARNAEQTEIISMSNMISWDWANIFHVTSNAGNTWTTVTPKVTLGDGFRELDFVSPTTGWARLQESDGHTALYRTTDGGSTWTMLYGHTVPTPTPEPSAFAQSIVNTLNDRNFTALPSLMDSSFTFAFWESQSTAYPSDQAIAAMQNNYFSATPMASDHDKDLTTLLGGLNPYAILNLDPAKSQALFVSGWGIDGRAEAILYVTQRTDGSLYWHSVLIAPQGFAQHATPTPSPASLIGPYAVIGVTEGDVLNIRQLAGVSYPVVGSFASDATNVMRTGPMAGGVDGSTWVEVQNPSGGVGWVNASYLTEYVSHDTFCSDTRIAPLIAKLKTSMNQSDGLMLSQLVSPNHGMNVHLWAYQPPVSYTPEKAVGAFVSTEIFNWGAGPRGEPDYGTFKDIIQPKMLDVLNAPNMETYCDSLDKVYPLYRPWPYPGIRYYNLYRPGTPGVDLDFRTWLIGIEYYQGEPYIYGMVNIVWEP